MVTNNSKNSKFRVKNQYLQIFISFQIRLQAIRGNTKYDPVQAQDVFFSGGGG